MLDRDACNVQVGRILLQKKRIIRRIQVAIGLDRPQTPKNETIQRSANAQLLYSPFFFTARTMKGTALHYAPIMTLPRSYSTILALFVDLYDVCWDSLISISAS